MTIDSFPPTKGERFTTTAKIAAGAATFALFLSGLSGCGEKVSGQGTQDPSEQKPTTTVSESVDSSKQESTTTENSSVSSSKNSTRKLGIENMGGIVLFLNWKNIKRRSKNWTIKN